jgi:DNA-directed RNA polymerase specialized sigma subunit
VSDDLLSTEAANTLVEEHYSWATSIARSVARAWNLDWQLDGLDGAAMEALIFCARRFSPGRGVPFKGYARKRIHEASSDAARKCKGWRRTSTGNGSSEHQAREISAELVTIFPELREGQLYIDESGDLEGGTRMAIRDLLLGASLIAAKQNIHATNPDEAMDYKKMIGFIVALEPVHQQLVWKVYWEGLSMRSVATEWETDELNVIREHKALMAYLQKSFAKGKPSAPPKVRPGLKAIAARLKQSGEGGMFGKLTAGGS